ncbi:D-alanyl-D-alanine carboxypeptidase/D-alanyl-D-alanine-endopeptidase [Marinovum sp. 2_MG-2023]|uniref:D-alanyl-D-alanine carboxypeptidase/D-alanyl-D-alanine endopeptidase n=1 Tax=unclassified Marinovum TaxID=2647166 RepID=UPI0026E19DAE|nr:MULTISPECIES: D-alanyl-D-alanine carboxypeptidase/D-alanyl-D-alanine-endopeptidase [unclassified Marinovum]MDO6730805.1 D-alanyl-D-alanine carboxypeptidase/D-alanyl-D-alanine-endopeptidase [Marinovum sp. 2_MG-2023]MDO6779990.1 D-alanyl-D-alanine carboxypeptidase/D-alanyl-D-alanine-endopeptidase [Marinovum sp. 1_MG-2023]
MTKVISRRLFLGAAIGFVAGQALGDAPVRSLRPVARPGSTIPIPVVFPSADELVAKAKLPGEVGYAVMDIETGLMREEGKADVGLPPASVAKTITALYALDALGEEHRFATSLHVTGSVTDGVVDGDLILAGGGDPTLDTDALAELAAKLKDVGIREVRGAFYVWGGFLPFSRDIDPGQPDHVGYNPAVSGLNLNFNRVHFQWVKQGSTYRVTMDGRSEKFRPDVAFARMAIENRSTPIYTYTDRSGRDEWTVAKTALGNGGARWLPVRKPELYAGEVFQTFARSHGIKLAVPQIATIAPGGSVVAQVVSPPLTQILFDMLKFSTNLTAEVVGLAATRARLGDAGDIKTSAQAMTEWLRQEYALSPDVVFVDHSGLGDASRMTAADMVLMLRAARQAGPLRSLLKPIPIRDADYKVIKDHPVQVSAKTGTLNFVSALGGYCTGVDGVEMAFAIFTADNARRATIPREERERPEGGLAWNRKSRLLQQQLLQRWGQAFANS